MNHKIEKQPSDKGIHLWGVPPRVGEGRDVVPERASDFTSILLPLLPLLSFFNLYECRPHGFISELCAHLNMTKIEQEAGEFH